MLESGQKFDKIKDVTTFFGKSYDRQKVIEQNKKNAVRHAYFREYLALQRLAYMFRFDAKAGYYLYPESEGTDDLRLRMNQGSTYEKNVTPREDISVTKHGLKQERTVAIMWLKLDIGGIDFHFRISGYKKSTQENWDDEWCDVDLTLQSRKWLDYHINSDETLLALEVEELRDSIDALLKDGLENYEHKECVEPDFEFHLYPKEDLRNNPRFTYVAPGHEILDVHMDFSVTFQDREGCLSSNRLLMEFDRDDLEKLLCYLNLVTKAVSKEDDTVKKAIAEGYIYGQNGDLKEAQCMPFTIVRQDITKMKVDAIVNAANTELLMGGGVCGAIFNAAGAKELQEACDKKSPIKTGDAVITPGFKLPAKFVIHAAGPVYNHNNKGKSAALLSSAYINSLRLAVENKCFSRVR